MKICETFSSIQGEGKYSGVPAFFIRLSNCTRKCKFCDTRYYEKGKDYSISEVISMIKKANKKIVIFTGGEPTLQIKEIEEIINKLSLEYDFHLETNGDITVNYAMFSYVAISPKDENAAKKAQIEADIHDGYIDVKIVTDLKINRKLIKYATMLMPLTTYKQKADMKVKQKVWKYCVKNNLKYCERVHVDVWGKSKNV